MEPSKKPSPASDPTVYAEGCTAASDHLDAVHATLARFWGGLSTPPDEQWRLRFEVAVSEIAANIVEHARPPVMFFRLTSIAGCVVAEFRDAGQGWNGPPEPANVLDELDELDALERLAERGRGLTLARRSVDEVEYERVGTSNHWRLMKRL